MPTNAAAYATRDKFDEAVAIALDAAAAYYDGSHSTLTDAEYDHIVDRVTASVAAHPDWDAAGLLDAVAAGVSTGGDVTHPVPMLSLAKATADDELADFLTRIAGNPTVTEVKLDGLAVRAEYRSGALVLVATRGDGVTGEDVTAQATTIAGLPADLGARVDLEVRGEVFMTDADFTTASANRVAAGKAPFVNPRNATAGTLRNADLAYHAPMTFAAYDASGPAVEQLPTHTERMAHVATLGIGTAINLIADLDPTDSPATVITAIGERRAALGFPIDGAVVKVNDLAARERIGVISRSPKWALAWKYPADQVPSVLRRIEVTIGKTGRLALTGHIDPVFVAGATVSKASLHNVDWLLATGMGVGSKVAVSRANDVIPYLAALDNSTATPWVPPASCPQCGGDWNKDTLLWRCTSPECSLVGWIVYALSRDVLDVDGASEAIASALVEAGLVNDVADLYALTAAQLETLQLGEGRTLGAKMAAKIAAGIAAAKAQPLNRHITSLAILGTGRTMSRRLAAHFGSLEALRTASKEQLAEVDGVGTEKAEMIYTGLRTRSDIIDRLIAAGITTTTEAAAAAVNGDGTSLPLAGKTYVISGTIPGYSRNEAHERIEALGGKASSSVSKTTTALITSETDTSKAKKAADLGIPVIDPAEFAKVLAG